MSLRFANSALLTTSAVLLEIGNALAKDFKAEALSIIKVLSHSSRVEVIEIDSDLMEKGLAVYEKYSDKRWGLVDCISFVVMRETNITQVLTFDKDFEQAGFTVLRD